MKKASLFLHFLLFSFILSAQSLSYIKHADDGHSLIQKIRSTDEGRIFATGYIYNQTTYEGTSYQSSGVDDIFLAELDESGAVIWLITEGSTNYDDRPFDMVIDETNNWIYITGIAGEGALFENDVINHEAHSAFVAKYDFEGNLIWLITPGESGGRFGNSISLDQEGNIYTSGEIESTATFGNIVFQNAPGSFYNRCFMASYAPDASLRWAKEIGGLPYQSQLHVNNQGVILFAASFNDSIRVDSTFITIPAGNEEDVFAARFDTQGSLLGYLEGNGTPRHFVGDITSNSQGDFILAGSSSNEGSITFGSETLNNAPNFILTWNGNDPTQFEVNNMGTGFFLTRELLMTSNDQLLITGMYTYMAALNNTSLPLDYNNEMFLIAYDDNNNPDWYFTGNGGLNDYGNSMCLLGDGSLLLGGYFGDTMQIDTTSISTGTFDINFFIARFDNIDGTTAIYDELIDQSVINFYPNPVIQKAYLELGDLYEPDLFLLLFDGTGKLLLKERVDQSVYELNRNGLPKGAYFWQLVDEKAVKASGKLLFSNTND